MRSKSFAFLGPAIFLTLIFATLISAHLNNSSGQQDQRIPSSRKPACGCYACGKLLAVEFRGGNKDCAGILSADACGDAIGGLPSEERARFCRELKRQSKDNSFADCPVYTRYCDSQQDQLPDNQAKCKERNSEDPPWFDPSAEGCQQLQDTRMSANWTAVNGGTCTITVAACNYNVLTYTVNFVRNENGGLAPADFSANTGESPEQLAARGLRPIRQSECNPRFYEQAIGDHPNTVCCDVWREGVSAGSGCNPERDADCDGLPNERDYYLNSTPYHAPPRPGTAAKDSADFEPANFDPRPPGLTWDELMPNEPCKKCKWTALSGKLTCSPDGRSEHEYKATWVCPTTGAQRTITKRAPATAPCTPPRGQA